MTTKSSNEEKLEYLKQKATELNDSIRSSQRARIGKAVDLQQQKTSAQKKKPEVLSSTPIPSSEAPAELDRACEAESAANEGGATGANEVVDEAGGNVIADPLASWDKLDHQSHVEQIRDHLCENSDNLPDLPLVVERAGDEAKESVAERREHIQRGKAGKHVDGESSRRNSVRKQKCPTYSWQRRD